MIKGIKTLIIVLRQIRFYALLKSLRFNIKYFGVKKGLDFPIFLSKNVLFNLRKGRIILKNANTGGVRIGFGNVGIFDKKYDRTVLEFCEDSLIVFKGVTNIGHGSKNSVQSNAKLILGDNFCITANSSIVCAKQIEFGDNCLLSWDILVIDSDLHQIKDEQKRIINKPKPIAIRDNVWIGAKSTILKGVEIGSGNVIGANSVVTNSFLETNCVVAGNSAKKIKSNIAWVR